MNGRETMRELVAGRLDEVDSIVKVSCIVYRLSILYIFSFIHTPTDSRAQLNYKC